MRGCKDTELGGVAERVGQVIEQGGDSLGDSDGGQDAGAKEGVSTETIIKSILGAWDIGVNPSHV